jgi:hypothetical protein
MPLSPRQERYLAKITRLVEAIQREASGAGGGAVTAGGRRRRRRSAEDAAQMRKAIRAERARGASVAKLAKKYGVSTAYIYMMRT